MAADEDAHVGVGSHIAEPLGSTAETRDHHVGAWRGMAEDLQDNVASGAGLSPDVFKHQHP
jgi:hypothetical protein